MSAETDPDLPQGSGIPGAEAPERCRRMTRRRRDDKG